MQSSFMTDPEEEHGKLKVGKRHKAKPFAVKIKRSNGETSYLRHYPNERARQQAIDALNHNSWGSRRAEAVTEG